MGKVQPEVIIFDCEFKPLEAYECHCGYTIDFVPRGCKLYDGKLWYRCPVCVSVVVFPEASLVPITLSYLLYGYQ